MRWCVAWVLLLGINCGPTRSGEPRVFLGSCRPTATTAWCAEFHGSRGISAEGFCSSFSGVFTLLACGSEGRVATCTGSLEGGAQKADLIFHLYRMETQKAERICKSQNLKIR
ncbi:MAG: hypothetical protein HS115_19910 [Spirochaetales bacterium]|nr:hypothetical protein [Spirochaetales bacterium]